MDQKTAQSTIRKTCSTNKSTATADIFDIPIRFMLIRNIKTDSYGYRKIVFQTRFGYLCGLAVKIALGQLF